MPPIRVRRRAHALVAAALVAGLVTAAVPADAAVPPPPPEDTSASALVTNGSRVLFVGNSFTQGFEEPALSFENDQIHDLNRTRLGGVAAIVARLSRDLGVTIDVSVEAVGGRSLQWHLDNRSWIFDQPWDAVVAQEYSLQPLPTTRGGDALGFLDAAAEVHERVRAAQPRVDTVLFQTWASPTSAQLQGYGTGVAALQAMQADLSAMYDKEAETFRWTRTAPVGDAFLRAVTDGAVDATPEDGLAPGTVRLWSAQDHRHAAAAGSYLAAAVLTATLIHRNPQLLPTGAGSAAEALGIPSAAAGALNRIAAELVPVPPPVSAQVRVPCTDGTADVRVLVRNHGDAPATVRIRGGAGVPEAVVPARSTVAVAVPTRADGRVPPGLRLDVQSADATSTLVLRPPAVHCASARDGWTPRSHERVGAR